MAKRIGLYPGTFDPITYGHLDVIARAAKMLDRLVVGIAINRDKGPLFDLEERVQLVEQEITALNLNDDTEIEIRPFDNLLIHFAEENQAGFIIRGLRAVSDFDYEFQMVGMNHRLNHEIETVFLMAKDKYQFIASKLVKEIARMEGDVREFVSPRIAARLYEKYGHDGPR